MFLFINLTILFISFVSESTLVRLSKFIFMVMNTWIFWVFSYTFKKLCKHKLRIHQQHPLYRIKTLPTYTQKQEGPGYGTALYPFLRLQFESSGGIFFSFKIFGLLYSLLFVVFTFWPMCSLTFFRCFLLNSGA